MSETPDAQPAPETQQTPVQDQGPQHQPSGIAAVDTVVEMLEQLDDLPVADHVAVFERAHESLRGALSDAASSAAAARA